ncbi:hypothetical protein H8N03_22995 [Ramlibacter sp. USB13]|uniref:Uncharacterized protein n=1 Tax=Ramlibacter cellulosilyticus TaxID=2764187 RepID=A0A923MVJ4_9BURK|nr:hypothetical protein [Ramlibacter cellulosilyticus]MBC5785826.1 hypothetical protein [Ramlibacter cellulosilyticus]
MENPVYHVLHEGRRLGPFDRRTIVGMKVKKTLSSKDVLLGDDGTHLTVGELVRQGQPDTGFEASSLAAPLAGSSSYSVVQGIHAAQLLEVEGKGHDIPAFKGEVEVRVQTKVLRISGRFREGLSWKEDRVKFPLQDIAHARLRGTVVDLWVRTTAAKRMQRVSLDLLKPAAAGELAESLPYTAPYPGSEPLAGRSPGAVSTLQPLMWAAVVGAVVTMAGFLVWALTRH